MAAISRACWRRLGFIVLYDVRGLTQGQARAVITDAALALIDAARPG